MISTFGQKQDFLFFLKGEFYKGSAFVAKLYKIVTFVELCSFFKVDHVAAKLLLFEVKFLLK